MIDGLRGALVSGLLFFFTIAALSRILTVKEGPQLITGFGNALANLFTNARS